MKKLVCLVLALLMLGSYAVAEDLGVQVIGGDNATMDAISLDDMKLGERYEIDGYAVVMPHFCGFADSFAEYRVGSAGDNTITSGWGWTAEGKVLQGEGDERGADIRNYVFVKADNSLGEYWFNADFYQNMFWQDSGKNADFLWLLIDIVNEQMQPYAFMENASVKVVFNDEYEFAGWIRQTNNDYNVSVYRLAYDELYANDVMINPADEEAIDMMYTGRYAFGCTLPMEVINSKDPLRVEIQLGDNELTYHIRK